MPRNGTMGRGGTTRWRHHQPTRMRNRVVVLTTRLQLTVFRMLALLIPYSVGVRFGSLLVRHASQVVYRRVVLWLLVGIGVSALTL